MRTIRIYQPSAFHPNTEIELSEQAAHHVRTVLRLKEGQALQLFNGDNQQCTAIINTISKKHIRVTLQSIQCCSLESPLPLHLGQAIAKGERMEWVVQKSVELGVHSITPLITEHCAVKLDAKRLEKKISQWQSIAISACEQCGRNYVPTIHPAIPLTNFLPEQSHISQKLILVPQASEALQNLPLSPVATLLLIGPEGGFSEEEMIMAKQHGFSGVRLGPRILRTETAAIVSQALLQARLGDL